LPPLHDAVDVHALETLLFSDTGRERDTRRTVLFEYCGRMVSVRTDGSVLVYEPTDADP
jgi:hypothetical protein